MESKPCFGRTLWCAAKLPPKRRLGFLLHEGMAEGLWCKKVKVQEAKTACRTKKLWLENLSVLEDMLWLENLSVLEEQLDAKTVLSRTAIAMWLLMLRTQCSSQTFTSFRCWLGFLMLEASESHLLEPFLCSMPCHAMQHFHCIRLALWRASSKAIIQYHRC